jgi:hypothetical protein
LITDQAENVISVPRDPPLQVRWASTAPKWRHLQCPNYRIKPKTVQVLSAHFQRAVAPVRHYLSSHAKTGG